MTGMAQPCQNVRPMVGEHVKKQASHIEGPAIGPGIYEKVVTHMFLYPWLQRRGTMKGEALYRD